MTGRAPEPRVSVLMPVYNAARFLGEAVASILEQTFQDLELIAVDDGSEDGSRGILEAFRGRDPRVHIISRSHTGLVGALLDGLRGARGELIARMDADDVSLPQRLERQVAFLDAHPECVAVSGGMLYIDHRGCPIAERLSPERYDDIERGLLRGLGECLLHGAVVVRRSALDTAGGYRPEFECAEDVDLFLRLAELGRLANLPEVVLKYRLSPGSICACNPHRQRELVLRAVQEAHVRRGLDFSAAVLPPPTTDVPVCCQFTNIAYAAALSGNRRTAVHYALQGIRSAPGSWRAWAVLSLLGPRPLTRWLQTARACIRRVRRAGRRDRRTS